MVDVAVIAGGPSPEHEVSLETSAEFLRLLRSRGHRARPVLVDRDEQWHFGASDADAPDGRFDGLPSEAAALTTDAALKRLADSGEVAFLGLHGLWGEDGQVQARLAAAGVPFTGSDAQPSRDAFDKEIAKMGASKLGGWCAKHVVLEGERLPAWGIGKGIGYPVFVKPVCGGSSVGVTRVEREEDLEAATRLARGHDPDDRCMVEEAVIGPEVTCAVIHEDGTYRPLPLIGIQADGSFYDYRAKYESDATRLGPHDQPPEVVEEIQRLSCQLAAGLGLRGVARVDFLVGADGRPRFLEINTLPGFTSHSLVPLAAKEAGLEPAEVVEALLRDALAA